MVKNFEDVKQSIVEAQLASSPKDKMINSIMKGTADLLSANDIINRLGITPNEFEKMVNLPRHYVNAKGLGGAVHAANVLFDPHIELINHDLEEKTMFPKPDLYILGKARWTKETFKKWLEKQCI